LKGIHNLPPVPRQVDWSHRAGRDGIIPLTGEACGLMYRILFDVTASGKRVLEKCFGTPNLNLPES
jgi:hypothetical protein